MSLFGFAAPRAVDAINIEQSKRKENGVLTFPLRLRQLARCELSSEQDLSTHIDQAECLFLLVEQGFSAQNWPLVAFLLACHMANSPQLHELLQIP